MLISIERWILFHLIRLYAASAGAFCGNKIVEAGEECDCGYDDDECVDKCCYPRQVSELDKIKNETAKGCTRKSGTQCRYICFSRCTRSYISEKNLPRRMHRPTCVIANLTSPFLTVPVKGPAVPANRVSSFLSLKMFNAKRNRIVVTIRLVMDDPPSVLHQCQGLTKLDVTRELR